MADVDARLEPQGLAVKIEPGHIYGMSFRDSCASQQTA